jgi:tetratricopeptide (TPR) repeat protein
MKTRKSILNTVCLVGWLLATSAFGQAEPSFNTANAEYASGHFKEAIENYNKLISSGQISANIFYDLANAYFRTGDFGHAILNYERALALDRHHPETQANLQIARDEARALELTPSGPERLVRFGNANQYAIIGAIGFWVAAFSVAVAIFSKGSARGAIPVTVVCLLISGLGIFGTCLISNQQKAKAIVTGDGVQARLATADNANSVLALPPGSEIKILSRRGDWIYAELPSNLRGWIPAKDAENVVL